MPQPMRLPPGVMVSDYLQRLQGWHDIGERADLEPAAINAMAERFAAAVLVPICGVAVQRIGSRGFEPDGFMLQRGSFKAFARAAVGSVRIEAWLPEMHPASVTLTIVCGTASWSETVAHGTLISVLAPLQIEADVEFTVEIALSSSFQPSSIASGSQDFRRLGCIVRAVEFIASPSRDGG